MSRWPPPPELGPTFFKGHGLGNDYLVFEEGEGWTATAENVRRACDRHRGVGADGIVAVLGAIPAPDAQGRVAVALRMFNPDGGEFERSGNGLRILASYVASRYGGARHVEASVGGDTVPMTIHGRTGAVHDISVEMGPAHVGPEAIDMRDDAIETDGTLTGPAGERLTVVPVSVGNPHLVVLYERSDDLSEERLGVLGPFLAAHGALAYGANVQLARPLADHGCEALIWERGVGRTSASGTSACAVAVAMVSSGRLQPGETAVSMPGGVLRVTVSESLDVVLRGPVEEVLDGRLRGVL